MHFECISPFKLHKIIFFSRKSEKILGFTQGWQNADKKAYLPCQWHLPGITGKS